MFQELKNNLFLSETVCLPIGQKFAGETKYKDQSEKNMKLEEIPW